MLNIFKFIWIGIFAITGVSYTGNSANSNEEKIILCTTSIAGDIITQIKPPAVTLMGPGVDPHLYKSKSQDHVLMNKAYVIVYSGLHLEGKMTDALSNLSKSKNVIDLSQGIKTKQLLKSPDFGGSYDPHFWFDIDLYTQAVQHCSQQLINFFPNDSIVIQKNTITYLNKLNNTKNYLNNQINELPKQKRILITAHDAFAYFGRKYSFTVKGIQGASTAAEAGLKDITSLVNYIIQNKVTAIFVETSVSEKNIQAIMEGCRKKNHPIKLGGSLYSDALGDKNTGSDTYIEMMKHNVNTIVNALK